MTETQTQDAVRSGSPDSAADRVADFYAAYIDAVPDGTDNLGSQLRSHFLTEDLQQRLAAWEGVLSAQAAVTHWEVRYHGSGAGRLFTKVTLAWGTGGPDAEHTVLAVHSGLSTRRGLQRGTGGRRTLGRRSRPTRVRLGTDPLGRSCVLVQAAV